MWKGCKWHRPTMLLSRDSNVHSRQCSILPGTMLHALLPCLPPLCSATPRGSVSPTQASLHPDSLEGGGDLYKSGCTTIKRSGVHLHSFSESEKNQSGGQTFTAPEKKKNYILHNRFVTSVSISFDNSDNKVLPSNLDKIPSVLQ